MSIISCIFLIFYLLLTIYFATKISNDMEDIKIVTDIKESGNVIHSLYSITFSTIKEFIFSLFRNRNIFGKFIGVIVFILSIPAIIIIIIIMCAILVFNMCKIIYLLGNKR